MLKCSEISSHESYTRNQPLTNGLHANHHSVRSVTCPSKEPIDRLLGELERPDGSLSTVRTAVGVQPGVTLKKEKLSWYVQKCIFKLLYILMTTYVLN